MFGSFGSAKAPQASAQGSGPAVETKRGHVIVIGNEKGGSGKTTTTMHLIVALLRLGFNIGSIDIDSRQRSLSRYVENRINLANREGVKMPMPMHVVVTRSPFGMQEEAEADERDRFTRAINKLRNENDFVVIDSPGSDTYLSRFAHSFADTIITPINDSFVDLDVLATVDGNTLKIVRPSIYSEMVWEQKLLRAKRDGGSIEWIVMRNRLSNIDARNKRFMGQVLSELSRRIGFRAAPGFSERVIFREMFLQGLTVLDVMDNGTNTSISLSHVAARQEVRDLLKILRIPAIDEKMQNIRPEDDSAAPNTQTRQPVNPSVPSTDAISPARHAAPPVAQPIGAQPLTAQPQIVQTQNVQTSGQTGMTPPAAPAPVMGFTPPPPPSEAAAATMAALLEPTTDAPADAETAEAEAAPEVSQTEAPAEQPPAPVATFTPTPAPTYTIEPRFPAAVAPIAPVAQPSIETPKAETPAAESGFSLSPAAFASQSTVPTAPTLSRDTSFLMSSSMLQQAASAIRSAARQALTPGNRNNVAEAEPGWTPRVTGDLPDIAVSEKKEEAKDWEAAS